jgi:hypothetical protein
VLVFLRRHAETNVMKIADARCLRPSTVEDVREKLARWQEDYNLTRPHSALQDQAPASFAADWSVTIRTPQESHELLETLT